MTYDEIVKKNNLTQEETEFFKNYLKCQFVFQDSPEDDDFLERWNMIKEYSVEHGVCAALNTFVSSANPIDFKLPDMVRLEIYQSVAGRIPVIYIYDKTDFENFITAVIYKGKPPANLSATGASFAFGKKTRFIVLSSKPYSNIPASEMGITEEQWQEKSMTIRREHECTHYFTKRFYGLSRNHLHDEIMADFFGLYAAFGQYRSEWFLRFMGIIGTNGGRLRFYIPDMSQGLYNAVSDAAVITAQYLQNWSETEEFKKMSEKQRIMKLCELQLLDICGG